MRDWEEEYYVEFDRDAGGWIWGHLFGCGCVICRDGDWGVCDTEEEGWEACTRHAINRSVD